MADRSPRAPCARERSAAARRRCCARCTVQEGRCAPLRVPRAHMPRGLVVVAARWRRARYCRPHAAHHATITLTMNAGARTSDDRLRRGVRRCRRGAGAGAAAGGDAVCGGGHAWRTPMGVTADDEGWRNDGAPAAATAASLDVLRDVRVGRANALRTLRRVRSPRATATATGMFASSRRIRQPVAPAVQRDRACASAERERLQSTRLADQRLSASAWVGRHCCNTLRRCHIATARRTAALRSTTHADAAAHAAGPRWAEDARAASSAARTLTGRCAADRRSRFRE